MIFMSILFERTEGRVKEELLEAPDFLGDLNLDQVIAAVTAGRQEYNLMPFFYTALSDIGAIKYRQEIFQDLENKDLFENIKSFAEKMRTMRRYLALVDKLYYERHKEGWFLEAAEDYCQAVTGLALDLSAADLRSRGFLAFRQYMNGYINSDGFRSLLAETQKLKADLATVKYCLTIKGTKVEVRHSQQETDYSIEVEETFEKFKQGAVKDYKVKLPFSSGMSHVEAQILDFVARLFPDLFLFLSNYCQKNKYYVDETIARFDREIQFYLAYQEYLAKFKGIGLKFCYPHISHKSKEVYDYEGFDLALADKLIKENSSVVCNDFYLKGQERILVVSGPNQGGKTTFARTFGQLHYLAGLGCPIPGREAQLFLCDRLFTHFEREENIKNLRGKLQDDLVRIHSILNQAAPSSIIIMNEIFTSTTLQDAVFLSKKVMEKIIELDVLCVWVTFIDELASFGEQTVSMVSTIVPENPALRTYKIIRKPADGLSYAIAIAEKYRLTYEFLRERLKS
jgi:DNA mismatch repair protein MutS